MTPTHDLAPIIVERQSGVSIVTINRPHAANAINAEVARLLDAVVQSVESDEDVRAAILCGAGDKVFCAGADLNEVARGEIPPLYSAGGFAGFTHAGRAKPWIAAVDGVALAGGCELALACDMIVASQRATFGLPETSRGLIAAAGGLYRLPRALPTAVALDLILSGARISAERAFALGMVSRLAPAGEARAHALSLAKEIAANAPLAVRESLAIARLAHERGDEDLFARSQSAQARLQDSDDFSEGAKAFLEKRPPRWSGR